MVLLLIFAVIAGAGTAITPCVLPVLPAVLSASAAGGRRRPLGITLGLAVTFTISIVALAQLVNGVGLPRSTTRDIAIVVLIAFGVVLLIPRLAQRIQAPLSRLARFGPRTRGDGFVSGIAVGAALGFVCAPCAGPILGAVIGVSATTGPTVRIVLVAIAYSAGLSAMMLLYGFGGRAVLGAIRRFARGNLVEAGLGVVLLATGVLMIFNVDTRFENYLSRTGFFDPTASLENSAAVAHRLTLLRPRGRFDRSDANLPNLGPAPDFTDTEQWFNSAPLHLRELRGHVVLIDFWTYTCINCLRTIPFVEGLYRHYHRYGLDVVGIETPEFTFEQDPNNVRQAIQEDGITYPVVQDNRYGTWNAYQNQYWPAEYLIDAHGDVRHHQFGEGNYAEDERDVRALLMAAGVRRLPPLMSARAQTPSANLGTPETYLNAQRDQGFLQPIQPGTRTYHANPQNLGLNQWALNGSWTAVTPANMNDEGDITPAGPGASISGGIQARDVYLVLTSAGGVPRRVRVLLGGVPIPAKYAGADVSAGGYVTVRQQRLYRLVALKTDGTFGLTVEIPPGVSAYDFTFG
jgi:cytochrome c biogenesis protein CcdA/thiol-disulfide isomerase/thioredoxin